MIGIACSSYFQRTAASLVVSYLVILPLAMAGVLFWFWPRNWGEFRLLSDRDRAARRRPRPSASRCSSTPAPPAASAGRRQRRARRWWTWTRKREHVVGLVIQRDQFPDKLFAPAKRDTLLEDGVNPVYDKEIRSEIFSQGTLMLRVVIQVSMLLAIPLMAVCLYIWPQYAPWYIAYVVIFNMLVGPVFSAGSVTSERERQTLDLLLTTVDHALADSVGETAGRLARVQRA